MDTNISNKQVARNINKPAYIIFVGAGIAFLIARDLSQATIFWGLALVFDPFNVNVPYQKRPLYQRLWLIVHLVITIILFVLMML